MITYNEIIKRIKSVFSEFGIEFDNFCEEVKLSSLGFVGNTLTSELEIALREEFDINEINLIYDEESTIGEIANEIMEQFNHLHYNYNQNIEIFEYTNITWLVILATISTIVLIIMFFFL